MISRRDVVGLPCLGRFISRRPTGARYAPGDLVEFVSLSGWESTVALETLNSDWQRHVRLVRHCLGTNYRIIHVDEEGSVELDVGKTAVRSDPALIGCSLKRDPAHVELVRRGSWLDRTIFRAA